VDADLSLEVTAAPSLSAYEEGEIQEEGCPSACGWWIARWPAGRLTVPAIVRLDASSSAVGTDDPRQLE